MIYILSASCSKSTNEEKSPLETVDQSISDDAEIPLEMPTQATKFDENVELLLISRKLNVQLKS